MFTHIFYSFSTGIQCLNFTVSTWSAFNSAFIASVDIVLSKSELFVNPEISDISTYLFLFSLHEADVVKYLFSMSVMFAS